jgi:hypothetical protein
LRFSSLAFPLVAALGEWLLVTSLLLLLGLALGLRALALLLLGLASLGLALGLRTLSLLLSLSTRGDNALGISLDDLSGRSLVLVIVIVVIFVIVLGIMLGTVSVRANMSVSPMRVHVTQDCQ